MDKLKRAAKKTAAVSAVSKSDSSKKDESKSETIEKEKAIRRRYFGKSTIKEEEQHRFAIFERFMNPKTNKLRSWTQKTY